MTNEQFKEWRKREGLTQSAAATFLGVTRGAVARYESGTRPVPKPVIILCGAMPSSFHSWKRGLHRGSKPDNGKPYIYIDRWDDGDPDPPADCAGYSAYVNGVCFLIYRSEIPRLIEVLEEVLENAKSGPE